MYIIILSVTFKIEPCNRMKLKKRIKNSFKYIRKFTIRKNFFKGVAAT